MQRLVSENISPHFLDCNVGGLCYFYQLFYLIFCSNTISVISPCNHGHKKEYNMFHVFQGIVL